MAPFLDHFLDKFSYFGSLFWSMFLASLFAAFQHLPEYRGGGWGWGEKHSFRNHTSQYQNLLSITTPDRHGADLLCNLDPHVVVTTERVWVRSGLSVCTCLSALTPCTCLSALHLLHSTLYSPLITLLVYLLLAPHSAGCLLK